LKRELLDPLASNGSGRYRAAIFDHAMDRPAPSRVRNAEPGAILIFDGLFLHRPELRPHWDLSILLDAPFTITIPRGASRGPGFGSPDPLAPSNRRYVGGQILYIEECDPRGRASVVIDHSDFRNPVLAAWRI
jgi:uridine kinase